MVPAPFRVVLDANVLFPFTLRDTLLRAAAMGMYQVYWSEEILDEAARNLVGSGRINEDQAAHLMAAIRNAFPEAIVRDHETLIDAMPNHHKDRHVAAAAVRIGAQVIVTSNLKDFVRTSSPWPPAVSALMGSWVAPNRSVSDEHRVDPRADLAPPQDHGRICPGGS